jgi:type VI secretion system protein ImpI
MASPAESRCATASATHRPLACWRGPPSGTLSRVFGLRVRIAHPKRGTTELLFSAFPVRIGRNEINDIALASHYVSQFHASLEVDGGRVFLTDLGSRNGTHLPRLGRAAPANTPFDLALAGYEFGIEEGLFTVWPVEVDDSPSTARRGGVHDFAHEMTHSERASTGDAVAENLAKLNPLYKAYREAWDNLFAEIQARFCRFDTKTQLRYCEEMMISLPLVVVEPSFKRLAGIQAPAGSASDIHVEHAEPEAGGSLDRAVASEGLRSLASWYLPGAPPPRTTEDVLGFLRAIQDTLDVFMKCFVPLRDGFEQFEVEMDIRRDRAGHAPNRVEAARTSRDLAVALLDWRGTQGNEGRAIENAFAALMTHQVATLNGVMKGVQSLLNELAPKTIEQEFENLKDRQGLQIGPFRFKQLWDLYAAKHGDLSAEDKHTHSLIFGPQFTAAYTQFAGAAAGPPPARTGPSVAPPPPPPQPGPGPPAGSPKPKAHGTRR